jgi:hypothetical protein
MLMIKRGIRGWVVQVIDFKLLAVNRCRFEPRKRHRNIHVRKLPNTYYLTEHQWLNSDRCSFMIKIMYSGYNLFIACNSIDQSDLISCWEKFFVYEPNLKFVDNISTCWVQQIMDAGFTLWFKEIGQKESIIEL